jgi:hypothetical protein
VNNHIEAGSGSINAPYGVPLTNCYQVDADQELTGRAPGLLLPQPSVVWPEPGVRENA